MKKEFAANCGRPINEPLEAVYKEAAVMHNQKKQSWVKIARKRCPLRTQDGHVCDKKCADKMRMGAKEFQTIKIPR
jgi:hypothetical protein